MEGQRKNSNLHRREDPGAYAEALRVEPDCAVDPRKEINRNVARLLTDILTPLCITLAQRIEALEPAGLVAAAGEVPSIYEGSYKGKFYVDYHQLLKYLPQRPGEYDRFVFAPESRCRIPIGAYGKDFASRLLKTVETMGVLSEHLVRQEVNRIESTHPELVSSEITLHSLDLSLKDGILSIAHAVSLVMAERIVGFDEPDAALAAIIEASMPTQLSQMIPFGMLGPFAARGIYFPGAVSVTPGGVPAFTKDFLKAASSWKRMYIAHDVLRTDSVRTGGFLGQGCPVGKKAYADSKTGVQAVSEAFLHVYRVLGQPM